MPAAAVVQAAARRCKSPAGAVQSRPARPLPHAARDGAKKLRPRPLPRRKSLLIIYLFSARSSVGLEYLATNQGVVGSNPAGRANFACKQLARKTTAWFTRPLFFARRRLSGVWARPRVACDSLRLAALDEPTCSVLRCPTRRVGRRQRTVPRRTDAHGLHLAGTGRCTEHVLTKHPMPRRERTDARRLPLLGEDVADATLAR